MWLMTARGFYSVVEHRDDADRLIVRARCQTDIAALREAFQFLVSCRLVS